MKYKHKQTGQIVTKVTDGLFHSKEGGYTLQRWIFENSNDWEEVKEAPQMPFKEHTSKVKQVSGEYVKEELNYLITAFRETKDLFGERKMIAIDKNGLYGGCHTLEAMLKNPPCVESNDFEIYSVKNSKGEEFTIGDKCNDDYIKNFVIGVNNNPNYMYVRSKNMSWGLNLESLTKEKAPIYTTTDGVDVFEGDKLTLFIARKDLSIPTTLQANKVYIYCGFSKLEAEIADRYLTFTSAENRDKYIKENQKKPLFISADSVEIFEGDIVYKAISESKTIVPYHASKGECTTEGGIRFSRHKAASEYLKKLDPVFISADGKEFYSDDTDYSLFSVLPKANWQENRYRLNDCIKFPKKEWLHFHTKEARQEYIDNNKPKYSLKDIEMILRQKETRALLNYESEFIEELKKLGK